MPVYQWMGQKIKAPSLDALKKYVNKQHLSGLPVKDEEKEVVLDRMRPHIGQVYDAEDSNGIPRGLLKKVLFQESRFREDIISGTTTSSKGATGIAQFMPATAKELGIDPTDPKQAIPAAGKYLSSLKEQTGSWESAVAAYNWGPGNLAKRGIERAPKETRDYLKAVIGDGSEVARASQ